MRVLCVIPAMGPGGAERAMARLSSALSERHEVTLVSWEAADAQSFYPLPEGVRQIRLGLLGGSGLERFRRLSRRLGALRQVVTTIRPDVIVSFMDTTNTTTVAACLGSGVPVVVSERTDPSRHYIPRPKKILRTAAYGLAARIVVQTRRVRDYFPRWMQPRIDIIPNPAPRPTVSAQPDRPDPRGRFRIVGLGRLGQEKGFDRLIAAFGVVARTHPAWDLVIFGEGDQRAALEAQAAALGLGARISLPGLTRTPEADLAASHLMAFPSRYEGFPNALAEAIATGLPAVAFSGISGVEDLILPEQTGLLVESEADSTGLAIALDRLMGDDQTRARFGAAARAHAGQWAPEIVHGQWETVLTKIVRDPAAPCG